MSPTVLTRITGLEVRRLPKMGNKVGFELCYPDGSTISAYDYREGDALRRLQSANYKAVQQAVFESQNWKCYRCQELHPLQLHHLMRRSKERKDRKEYTVGLDATCHEYLTRHPLEERAFGEAILRERGLL